MKKRLAGLLAAILVFSTIAPEAAMAAPVQEQSLSEPSADQSGEKSQTNEPVTTASDDGGEGSSEEELEPVNGSIGQVEVSIGTTIPVNKEFTVTLEKQVETGDGSEQAEAVALSGTESKQVSFTGLEPGEYNLSISADGFLTHTQTINVRQMKYSLSFLTGLVEGMDYSSAAHYGVLQLGDANGDQKIDASDATAIIDEIEAGESANSSTDLNGDGVTNLVDLEYYTKHRVNTDGIDCDSAVSASLVPETVTATASEGTEVSGDLDSLLTSEGSGVTLTPVSGEAISKEHPVQLELDVAEVSTGEDDTTSLPETGGILINTASKDGEDHVTSATITVTYVEDGKEYVEEIPAANGVSFLLRTSSSFSATIDENGVISVNLGSQVAVKKVTITIVGTKKNTNLAEISSVEFVNDMESRIPEPEMNIPTNLQAVAGDAHINLSWNAETNVTGYEVWINKKGAAESKAETIQVTGNSCAITSYDGRKLRNLITYVVKVQSINGTWRSGYCSPQEATPSVESKPDKPDNVQAVGKYRSIVVTWKEMDNTASYNLYYRKIEEDGAYTQVEGIQTNTYTISDLEPQKDYEIYVTGVNSYGEGPGSLHCQATPTDLDPAQVSQYGVINYSAEGQVSEHIISATMSGATMTNSELDEGSSTTAWGAVDNNASSYYFRNTWDDGGFNALGSRGITCEFDQAYEMDTIGVRMLGNGTFGYAKYQLWDEDGNATSGTASVSTARDSGNRAYCLVKLPNKAKVKKIQLGFANALANGTISICDVYYYHYDPLMDEVMGLYEDDLHTVLKESTTQDSINALRERVNALDSVSGAEHPNKEALLRELDTAEKILQDGKLNAESVEIFTSINTKDVNRGFTGLNAWQPLGVTAAAGEQITVYVGSSTQKTGTRTNLRLYITQYHSEHDKVALGWYSGLYVGANTFTMPSSAYTEQEGGGALYIEYDGTATNTRYAVRVSGGVQVPILNLYKTTDEAKRLEKTTAYVEKLQDYVADMEAKHTQVHKNSDNQSVNKFEYDEQNCILGATDIMLDTMMFSVPAQQVLAGAYGSSAEEKAQNILNSMDAMEDMMYLFYQHKGLNSSAGSEIDRIPNRHQNIRYQRMFKPAFMYAAANHIGIEYPQTASVVRAVPIETEDGKYVSGNYFGWGIAHEIGHNINQSQYEVAEITNNYFAQLAQAKDTNEGMRFQYPSVYDKVTSGTKGQADERTQIALYWQLHLAYDKGYNYKTYEDYNEQLANLFYARVDTYARTPSKAPSPKGVALTLVSGSSDQNLMRLACAAAEKDILEFFERWGMTPDNTTKAYAQQFEKETRAIYYVNDDSRVYTMQGGVSSLSTDGTTEAVGEVTAKVNDDTQNQVDFTLSSTLPEGDLLGYEIVRSMISGGEVVKETAGFTTGDTFSDTLTTVNNRVVTYEVTAIDKYLNRSAVKVLDPIKIVHDGSLDKKSWTITATGMTATGESTDPGEDSTDLEHADVENLAEKAIDGKTATVYEADVKSDAAELEMQFNKTLVITGFKYTAAEENPLGDYEIQIYDGNAWEKVAEGTFSEDKVNTVYFANADNKYVSTYEASAVKLIVKNKNGQKVSIAELDVLGVSGDNVDFRTTDDGSTTVIGTLKSDYKYGTKEGDVIPAGSTIFTGKYKGNAAYNVVLLFDQNGEIVGGVNDEGALQAQQIILSDVPEEGNIANTTDGIWIYWIEPGQNVDLTDITKVRAELYRVNNAMTNEGQRLVSDSLFETMPETLPEIELSGNSTSEQE